MNYVMAIWNTAQQALVYAIRGQGIRIVVDELAYLHGGTERAFSK